MKCLCEALTGGGPVAIMPLAEARKWNGGFGDYFRVIETHVAGGLQYFELDDRCWGCLFHYVDDGEFVVYHSKEAFLIISERYAPDEEHSVTHVLPDYQDYTIPSDKLELPHFGGQIAIFDSAYPGKLISLTKTGYQTIDFPSDSDERIGSPMIPNAIVVDVKKGLWQATAIHRHDDSYSFDGVLFRRIG